MRIAGSELYITIYAAHDKVRIMIFVGYLLKWNGRIPSTWLLNDPQEEFITTKIKWPSDILILVYWLQI